MLDATPHTQYTPAEISDEWIAFKKRFREEHGVAYENPNGRHQGREATQKTELMWMRSYLLHPKMLDVDWQKHKHGKCVTYSSMALPHAACPRSAGGMKRQRSTSTQTQSKRHRAVM